MKRSKDRIDEQRKKKKKRKKRARIKRNEYRES